jgi:glycerol-3-phosphate dehydrogenase
MMREIDYDVAIIGAGAVGTAIARALARYRLRVVLVERQPDVGMGTSKASTAIWHTGFDAKPGTLEARLLQRSYPLTERFMAEAGVPVERIGGLLIAWNDEQLQTLPSLMHNAQQNGVHDARLLEAGEIYAREPHLGPGARGGLYVPGEGIFCTYTLPLAFATQAVLNGVSLRLNFAVEGVLPAGEGFYRLEAAGASLRCRFLVNAAGLHSDEIDHLLGHHAFQVRPRRGELIVYDKFARELLSHVLLPVPTATTKGVLISPTVYGNVLLGPTAEELRDKSATETSAAGLQSLLARGRAILPALLQEEVTASYAGLRAATEHGDYQIRAHPQQRYICVGGIRSTGLSGAMGIAEHVVELLAEAGLVLKPRDEFVPVRMPFIGEAGTRPYQSAERIAANPDYGRIVCHCERVTRGEILDALHAVIPARTVDGLRRRTRALQGRCQGFNCQGALLALLVRATGQPAERLLMLEPGDAT